MQGSMTSFLSDQTPSQSLEADGAVGEVGMPDKGLAHWINLQAVLG
jgi:hypothetical protein